MRTVAVALFVVLSAQTAPVAAQDSEAAERQYRIARRLAAENSPEAGSALRKVVELDPRGPLADDALVEQALLMPIPHWPEELGRIDVLLAREARALLDRVMQGLPGSDRVVQARYHRALLRLEPLPGHDPSAARLDLTAVTASNGPSALTPAARYALAWLYEQQGRDDRAIDAYHRLLIDAAQSEAGLRASVGRSRLLLRQGRFGAAARWLQQAVEAEAGPETFARPLRELAVRRMLQQTGADHATEIRRIATEVRVPSGFAPVPGGGLLLGDRRQGRVVELDERGATVNAWELQDIQTVAVDPGGRRFAAAGTFVHRLEPGQDPVAVAPLGTYAPLASLVADGVGGFWLLDRRGKNIGRIGPGDDGPRPFWESYGPRLVSLVWDGRRLVAADGKTRSVLAFDADGRASVLSAEPVERPVALAVDPAGQLVLLDGRSGAVRWLRRGHRATELAALPAVQIGRSTAVGLGTDGAVHLFDESNGEWVILR